MKAFSFDVQIAETQRIYLTLDGNSVQEHIGGPSEIAQALKAVHPHLNLSEAQTFMKEWAGLSPLVPDHPYIELSKVGRVKDTKGDPVQSLKMEAFAKDLVEDENTQNFIVLLAGTIIGSGGNWSLADSRILNRDDWANFQSLTDEKKVEAVASLPQDLFIAIFKSAHEDKGGELSEEILGKFALL